MSSSGFAGIFQIEQQYPPAGMYSNGLIYHHRPPCPELQPYIANYWSITPSANTNLSQDSISVQVLPDGGMDIIFFLDNADTNTCWSTTDGRTIIGLRQKPLTKVFDNQAHRFGIRFQPGGAFPFLRHPVNRFRGIFMTLDSIWGNIVSELEERLHSNTSLDEKIQLTEQILLKLLQNSDPPDVMVMRALTRIHLDKGMVRVEDLAETAGTNARNLNRKFEKWIGFSPKSLCRVVRFRSALQKIMQAKIDDFSDLAFACGYYDQSHFVNEFKYFYGLTPYKAIQNLYGSPSCQET